jgi:5'-3' exonuclease
VVHIDKDLDCIVGDHYNPRREQFYKVDENSADMHYWLQMLKGDPTDNLPGLPKVGPKTAEKMLKGVPMNRRKSRVLAAYRAKFGIVNWKEKLLETANGIHILRTADDFFNI